MLNGFQMQKRLTQYMKIQEERQGEQRIKDRQQKANARLVENYKARIDRFIKEMTINPILVNQYHSPKETQEPMKQVLEKASGISTERGRIDSTSKFGTQSSGVLGLRNLKNSSLGKERTNSRDVLPTVGHPAKSQLREHAGDKLQKIHFKAVETVGMQIPGPLDYLRSMKTKESMHKSQDRAPLQRESTSLITRGGRGRKEKRVPSIRQSQEDLASVEERRDAHSSLKNCVDAFFGGQRMQDSEMINKQQQPIILVSNRLSYESS